MSEQLQSLLAEHKALRADLNYYGEKLTDWGHDLLTNRIEMLDEMIANERAGY